jgi:DNA primase small subunit
MAGPKGEAEMLRLNFLKKRFSRYYTETELPPPLRLEEREYGVITERGGMWRHLAFADLLDMQGFMRKHAPLHAYHSSAYYKSPGEKFMDEKEWLGADLVFDLDADHIEGAEKMGLEEQLAAVKVEFKKLLDSYLLSDFGFAMEDIQIVFSGGRGYHAHVRDPRVLDLDSHERREIVDYITLTEKDVSRFIIKEAFDSKTFQQHSTVKYKYLLPKESTTGWRGKFRTAVLDYLDRAEAMDKNTAVKELARSEGIGKKTSEELWSELFEGEEGKRGADIIRRTNSLEAFSSDRSRNQFARFVLDRIRVLAGETDEPVTSDVKRLIRLPETLHGKSGLVVRRLNLDELDGFEPLRDAVWEGFSDEVVKVTGTDDFSIKLKGQDISVKQGKETELPEFAAVFFLGQKRSEVTIS